MNKDVINLCYYFSCKIFALDHWRVEISTHWPNLASAILIWRVGFEATSQNGECLKKLVSYTVSDMENIAISTIVGTSSHIIYLASYLVSLETRHSHIPSFDSLSPLQQEPIIAFKLI